MLAGPDGAAADGRAEGAGTGSEPDPKRPSRAPATLRTSRSRTRTSRRGRAEGRWSFLTEMVVLFAVALTIALLIKTFVVQPFFIPSGSMENTLLVGDKVLVNKLVYHLRPIARGDIVVFNGAGSWDSRRRPGRRLATTRSCALYDDTLGALFTSIEGLFGTAPGQTDYIKRVIGDTRRSRRLLQRAGPDHGQRRAAAREAPTSSLATSRRRAVRHGRAAGAALGDGRQQAGVRRLPPARLRVHDPAGASASPMTATAPCPRDKVIGRAFMIVWPPSRIRILPIPSTFDQAEAESQRRRRRARPAAARSLSDRDAGAAVGALPAAGSRLGGGRAADRAGATATAAGDQQTAQRPREP